jgi:hypothetical protein
VHVMCGLRRHRASLARQETIDVPRCACLHRISRCLTINFTDSCAILNIFDTKAIVIATRQNPTNYPRTPLLGCCLTVLLVLSRISL